jgi:hypothetical protein
MNLFIYLIHIILYFPLSKIKQDTVLPACPLFRRSRWNNGRTV